MLTTDLDAAHSYFVEHSRPDGFVSETARDETHGKAWNFNPLVVTWIAAAEKADNEIPLRTQVKVVFKWLIPRLLARVSRPGLPTKQLIQIKDDTTLNAIELYACLPEELPRSFGNYIAGSVFCGMLLEDGSQTTRHFDYYSEPYFKEYKNVPDEFEIGDSLDPDDDEMFFGPRR